MRIGILGGSFDPPHLAHRALAQCALSELSLDLLVVAVAYRQWQKQHDATAADRLEMAKLNFAMDSVVVSDVDLVRQTPTFTIDTLHDLKVLYPDAEFVFITGADAISGLPSWHQSNELAASLKFAAARRENQIAEVPVGFEVQWLECDLPKISSTQIRELLAAGDAPQLADLLHADVSDYIVEKNLYR